MLLRASRQSVTVSDLSGHSAPPSMRHGFPALALATFLAFATVDRCAALTCYYCTIQPPSGRTNLTAKLCSMFDYSTYFYIDCPYSTFCEKKTYEMTLQKGKNVRVSERGCAPQKWNDQVLRNGNWHSESRIDSDIYSEGCHLEEGLGLRAPKTEYCYCTNRLCNNAHTQVVSYSLLCITALTAFLTYSLR